MNDSTQLLTTIAQPSGGFVAIISGFVVSKVLSTASERERLQGECNKLNQKMIDKMHELDINALDLVIGKRKKEVVELRKDVELIIWQLQSLDNATYLKRA